MTMIDSNEASYWRWCHDCEVREIRFGAEDLALDLENVFLPEKFEKTIVLKGVHRLRIEVQTLQFAIDRLWVEKISASQENVERLISMFGDSLWIDKKNIATAPFLCSIEAHVGRGILALCREIVHT
jgi:hypothetical protein